MGWPFLPLDAFEESADNNKQAFLFTTCYYFCDCDIANNNSILYISPSRLDVSAARSQHFNNSIITSSTHQHHRQNIVPHPSLTNEPTHNASPFLRPLIQNPHPQPPRHPPPRPPNNHLSLTTTRSPTHPPRPRSHATHPHPDVITTPSRDLDSQPARRLLGPWPWWSGSGNSFKLGGHGHNCYECSRGEHDKHSYIDRSSHDKRRRPEQIRNRGRCRRRRRGMRRALRCPHLDSSVHRQAGELLLLCLRPYHHKILL